MVFGRPGHEPEDDTDVADAAERAYRENHVIRKKLHRPSLKITRRTDQRRARSFTFEVWNPFTGDYQVEESIEAAMLRVNQLAGQDRDVKSFSRLDPLRQGRRGRVLNPQWLRRGAFALRTQFLHRRLHPVRCHHPNLRGQGNGGHRHPNRHRCYR